ncbi:MAG: sigma 54-interacting transcriptional regulator [Sandaracinaceae bacterium]|nr:sigma 54-interacting transcriptional regulator [Sandaracinaceae bacterium]
MSGEDPTELVTPFGEPAPSREARLAFRTSSGASGTVTIDETSLVGSAPSADVVIDDPTVSRLHAEIQIRDDGVWIRDLGSRNGTFVQGIRVESAQLGEGTKLRLGAVVATVSLGARPAEDAFALDRFGRLVGRSHVMKKLFARLDKAARSEATVLVLGETGTGKELVAESIHQASPRRDRPFVVVDCGALHASLLESELFGHVRGAFTGASSDRAGAFEVAQGGTLFLDEIGEVPLELQPKLLRALEARTIRRLGETRARSVDVRIVAATHRDLAKAVAEGTFREDLYFRLAVLSVRVPPLRDRLEDLPLLMESFGASPELFGPEVLAELRTRRFAGNVRELRNYVERAAAFGLDESDLEVLEDEAPTRANDEDGPIDVPIAIARAACLDRFEKRYLAALLERAHGNVTLAARLADLDRTHLHRLLAKHGLGRRGA